MKPFSFIAAVIFLLYLSSCKEVNTLPTSVVIDTTKTVQQKNVLVEDFTGVRCVNCPQANAIVDTLRKTYTGRVEAVSFHSGIYAVPYPFSKDTFETAQSVAVENFLGPCSFYPEGCVDRKLYSGQSTVLLDRTLWAGLVSQELVDTDNVNINVSNNYNSTTRSLNVSVTVKYINTITLPEVINVMITESNIVDPQLTPTGIDTFYVHNNVFREALTNVTGSPITQSTAAGSRFTLTYSYILPSTWNAQNCRVVAYVCDNTSQKDVLQVSGANVQ